MKAKLLILMLGLFPLLAIGQNYEMRGDSCFNIGDYQKSVKQYNAAIELSGESTSLINKRNAANNCYSLLQRAQEAESNSDTSEAAQYYTQLYEQHQLAKYQEKADQYQKQLAQQENLAQQKALAQSYEQEGDQYFSAGKYKSALEKYKAAIAAASTSALIQKRDKTSNCYSLLTKAQEAEKKMEYSNASQLYKQLYGIHPRSTYNEKSIDLQKLMQQMGDPTGYENAHGYVDLGLSVKWATYNVGANKPEDNGDYFAWGEVKPKANYNWNTYKWCKGSSSTLTKYNNNKDFGIVDYKTTLDKDDDAAAVNWRGKWRMPTYAEINELCENCTWTWTNRNGIKGYKVKSKINGNSIFFPAAGFMMDAQLRCASNQKRNEVDMLGDYWSSSLYTHHPVYACREYFRSTFMRGSKHESRHYGFTIRPVCP